jgi:hypothetical protein
MSKLSRMMDEVLIYPDWVDDLYAHNLFFQARRYTSGWLHLILPGTTTKHAKSTKRTQALGSSTALSLLSGR